MNKVYTIGYEGKDIEDFIDLLEKHEIKQVIDVRSNPRSRKQDFTKATLKDKLFKKSLKYEHLPELGGLGKEDYLGTMKQKEWLEAYEDMKSLARHERSVLMCLESDPMKCHRRFISEELENEGWEVIHIGDGGTWKSKQLDDF